jgi:hypothetical protein
MFKYIVVFFFLIGCNTCKLERDAHKVMANRHFPALVKYYQEDINLIPLYKESLIKSIEEWDKLIQSK